MKSYFKTSKKDDENWISVSDIMAGLMMVFLLIMIIYARSADDRLQNAQEIVVEWRNTELAIYQALQDEFGEDIKDWNAQIEKETLTIRFLSPDILFETGKAELKSEFKAILDDFIPRYMDLLVTKFVDKIEEVRIEGHTSTEWYSSTNEIDAFINNMGLSQHRTRTVLNYILTLDEIGYLTPWVIRTVSANGLSSARPILDKNGHENKRLSKRVDFTINTKAKEALFRIIDKLAPEIERGFQ